MTKRMATALGWGRPARPSGGGGTTRNAVAPLLGLACQLPATLASAVRRFLHIGRHGCVNVSKATHRLALEPSGETELRRLP